MKKVVIFSSLLMASFPLIVCQDNLKEKQDFYEMTAKERIKNLSISNDVGNIDVFGSGRDNIKVRVTRRATNEKDFERLKNAVTIIKKLDDNGELTELLLKAKVPDNCDQCSIDFDVIAPDVRSFLIKNISGDVYLGSIDGNVDSETISGDQYFERIHGAVKSKSVSGEIRIEHGKDAAPHTTIAENASGDIIIVDASGNVYTNNVSGDTCVTMSGSGNVSSKSVSGDIELWRVMANVLAHSVSGNILMKDGNKKNWDKRSVDLKLVSGKVEIK